MNWLAEAAPFLGRRKTAGKMSAENRTTANKLTMRILLGAFIDLLSRSIGLCYRVQEIVGSFCPGETTGDTPVKSSRPGWGAGPALTRDTFRHTPLRFGSRIPDTLPGSTLSILEFEK